MKRFFVAAVSGLFLFAASCSPQPKPFQDPEGAFTVAFPAKTEPQASTANTALNQLVGTTDTTTQIAETDYAVDMGTVGLVVKVFDMRGHELVVGEAVRNAIDAWKTQSSQFSVSNAVADGRDGSEVSYTLADGSQTVFRLFYSGGRLYSVSIKWPANTGSRQVAEAKHFLNSFHFTATKTEADDWATLNDPYGFFSSPYPVAATFSINGSTIQDLSGKDVPVTQYLALSRDEDASTGVEVFDMRGRREQADLLILASIEGLKKNAASVLADSGIQVDGQSGRELSYTTADGNQTTTRMVVMGAGRIYALTAAWTPSASEREIADAKLFFEKFHFTSPQPDDWTPFTDPAGAFNVSFPAAPYTKEDKKIGTIIYSFGESADDTPLSVGINVLHISETEAMKTVSKILKEQAAQVVSDTSIELDNHAGREVELLTRDETRVVIRYFAFNKKLYQVAVEGLKGAGEHELADQKHFLNSFHFAR